MRCADLQSTVTKGQSQRRFGIGLNRAAVLLIALGAAWRVLRYAMCFPFWGDEAYLNINYLHREFGELAGPLEYAQICPVGFAWMQRAVYGLLGGGEYALRGTSLAAGIAALLLFWRMARTALSERGALLASAIFASSYYLVRHTCESKPYAMDLFAATLLMWLGMRWLEEPGKVLRAAAFAVCAAGAVWLSYPAVFVAGGVLVTCGMRAVRGEGREQGRSLSELGGVRCAQCWTARRALVAWGAAALLVAASFACFYFFFAVRQRDAAAGTWLEEYWRDSFPPRGDALGWLWWLVKVHTGRMFAHPTGGPDFASAPVTLVCLLGAVALWRQQRRRLVALLIAPAILTLVAAVLRKYPYGGSARVALHLAPAICLAAGAGAVWLLECVRREETRERLQGVVLGALIIFVLGGAIRDVVHPFKEREDVQARAVMRRLGPILAEASEVACVNPLYGTWGPPEGPKFEQTLRYYLELYSGRRLQTEVGDGDTASRCVADAPYGSGRRLLAYRGAAFGPTREYVESLLARRGLRIESTEDFALNGDKGASLIVYAVCGAQ